MEQIWWYDWYQFIKNKMSNICQKRKIASLGRQEPQPAGTAKWPTTLRFGKILGTTSVVRSIENPEDVLQKIHRPRFLTSSFHILKPKKQL